MRRIPFTRILAIYIAALVVLTICLECHNGGGGGTRHTGVDVQSSRHNLLDPKYQKCTTCHVRLHGSNADQFFLR